MHTKSSLIQDLKKLNIQPSGTLLVHSSYKSIGEVEGRAETVLDALETYMENGLLVLPTHTWSTINKEHPLYSVKDTPSCVGILTELFRKRERVFRSAHPTHSVAAKGKEALAFVQGEEYQDTPCGRNSVYGRLFDRNAQIMLIGVSLNRNTFIHGIEEWMNIPGRITDTYEPLQSKLPDGTIINVYSRRHFGVDWSLHFPKVEEILLNRGAMIIGRFGEAETRICHARKTAEVIFEILKDHPTLFSDDEPLDQDIIAHYSRMNKSK